jgi:hypothetical protein
MDLLKKVELLLSAKTRAALPRRNRHSSLDEQEAEILAEIRKALRDVEAEERKLAKRLKMEQAEAQQAAERGDWAEQNAHERRAAELEQKLEDESILAINLEEKLAALEEKLALAKEAVKKEAGKAASREAEASKVLAQSGSDVELESEIADTPVKKEEIIPADFADDDAEMAALKSRLSE